MRLHFNRMRLCLSILIRPLCFLILLGLASFMILRVCILVKQFKHDEVLQAHELRNRSVSEVERTARMIVPLNSSTANLARYLSSSLNGTELSFSTIQAKIAPPLFQSLLTIPDVTEVGYNGLDALAFSYFKDDQQTFARFSNSSKSSVIYTQPVNRDTGKLFGEAISSNSTPKLIITTFQQGPEGAIPYHSLEVGHNGIDLLFTNTVPMDGRGQISIKFPAQKAIEHFAHLDLHGGLLHLAANGKVLIETKLSDVDMAVDNGTLSLKWKKPNGDYYKVKNTSCVSDDGELGNHAVKIKENQHEFYCSAVKLAGIDSVYVLTFGIDGMETAAHIHYILAIILLVLMLLGIIFSLCLSIFLILKAARREIVLCAALIKQKESTQQAERKSMSMSYAFATNSHDLRAPLKTITVLVEECCEDVIPNSQLMTNLTRINAYAQDLLGLLNTVLDQSKIEADKIELKDEEFNLTQVLEEVVDIFYPLGIRKGVDVILDPCDGSILKFYQVRGDKVRLRQILLNLLSNATKFTSEGHVVIRTTVRKTSKENAILASNHRSLLNCLSKLCHKTSGSLQSADNIHTVHQNPNCMEFIFEVDDTGCGIPKEKQKSVFENYVQVKTHDSEQEGWGLGLGIVQSLVRMMGGEIKIVDNENGERGTCFRFNIFLATRNLVSTDIDEHGNHMQSAGSSIDLWNYFGLYIRSPAARLEGSHVVLLLDGKERRKISRTFIENFGIKVSVAKTSNELLRILREITHKLDHIQPGLPEKSEPSTNDYRSASNNSNSRLHDGSGAKDGQDSSPPQRRNVNSKGSASFMLVVIDAVAGTSLEVNSVLSSFKKESRSLQCKIVWWENPVFRINNSRRSNNDLPLPPYDYIVSKPLHGSVLYEVLGLLPEFHGAFQSNSFKLKAEAVHENDGFIELVPSKRYVPFSGDNGIQICTTPSDQRQELQEIVIHDQTEGQSPSKPLQGKTVLVVDDDGVLRKVTSASLSQLGAKVDVCENGKDALDLVCQGLNDQGEIHDKALPYDYIFMDCQMPIVDGYEATRLIRKEEKLHGIRIPIFALTFNSLDDEENTKHILDAGMDYHLCKPFKLEKLMEAIRSVEYKMKA